MHFVDDASRYWCLYLLKQKSQTLEAFKAFKAFKAHMELATGRKVKVLHDDKGGEFMSWAFEEFCTGSGIQRRHTMITPMVLLKGLLVSSLIMPHLFCMSPSFPHHSGAFE